MWIGNRALFVHAVVILWIENCVSSYFSHSSKSTLLFVQAQVQSNNNDIGNKDVGTPLFTCPEDDHSSGETGDSENEAVLGSTMTEDHKNHDSSSSTKKKAENDFEDYWSTYLEMNEENLQDLKNFRERGYDYRSHSYSEMKRKTYTFKRETFGSELKNGDHIYESACGQGLNLFMTLEILRECCNITNLTVHGNDYLSNSVLVAKEIFRQEQAPWFRTGQLCTGDSTNLYFVPSNTFDMAYTGFIDPLLDPLNLMDHPNASLGEKVEMIEEICTSKDPQVKRIAQQMQKLQENWHAKWVSELLRIVKPGKYVVIEDVGWPACTLYTEWGGVDTDWWEQAVETYQWDVDLDSIEILQDKPYTWYSNRYNVVLRRLDVHEHETRTKQSTSS